ncbi:NAD-dependent epimerase/dehydratase family protein [Streptomyces niveus]|uniref:NAD-dependent epimerase/dehydratase family protein n=1 Tax=Streptomyces niveus TaxID=193462 RepID=UPI0036D262AE
MGFVVVGGAGFLGRALVRDLADAGHTFHVVDLPDSLAGHPVEGATSCRGVSTENGAELARVLRLIRPDIVVDLAYLVGPPAEEDVALATHVNLVGPIHSMRAAQQAGARLYVQASSIAVYGPSTERWGREVTEEDMLPLGHHVTTYGAFKCVNEFQLARFAAETGMRTTSVRLSIVLGPGRGRGLATWSSRFLADVGAGKRHHHIPVPGSARSSLLSAHDAVRFLRLVSAHPRPRAVYNSGGHDLSAHEIAAHARRLHPGIRVVFDESATNIPFVHAVSHTRARGGFRVHVAER